MDFNQALKISLRASVLLCLGFHAGGIAQSKATEQSANVGGTPFPSPETLSYRIEWRMVTAGEAKLQLTRDQQDWQIQLNLESAGLVSRLFRVDDTYKARVDNQFCAVSSTFEAQEGKRHVVESEQFNASRHKAIFDFHDLSKNLKQHNELDIAPCAHEIVGALEALRVVKLDAGKSMTMPIANGKKMANAKIQAQGKENLSVNGKTYLTMRYEAFVFDNVLFRRKGSLMVWVSDDAAHLPVQMQFQMGFPIGNITLNLEKAERI
jgi:hypothetical protein